MAERLGEIPSKPATGRIIFLGKKSKVGREAG
jgi:hypothetical protein